MANNKETDWTAGLLQAQRQYLDTINRYYTWLQDNSDGRNSLAGTWQNFLQQCNQTLGAAVPREAFPVFSNLLHQPSQLNTFYNQFAPLFPAVMDSVQGADWSSFLEKQFDQINLSQLSIRNGMPDFMFDTAHQLHEYWQEFVHTVTQLADTPGYSELLKQYIDRVPKNAREEKIQQELLELHDVWVRYQEAAGHYLNSLSGVNSNALDLLKQELLGRLQKGDQIRDFRDFYNLWTRCQEQAYSEIVFTDEHASIFATMINTFMSFKLKLEDVSENAQEYFDRNPDHELQTVIRQQDELQSDLQESRKELDESRLKIEELTRELGELKKLVCTGQKIMSETDSDDTGKV